MSIRALVLVVEDEPAIASLLEAHLRRAGYDVLIAADETVFQRLLTAVLPSVVMIDANLRTAAPESLIARLRDGSPTMATPVLMLGKPKNPRKSGSGNPLAPDAWLAGPFTLKSLQGALTALLRRPALSLGDEPMDFGCLHLDPASRHVTAEGRAVRLAATEFRLLHFLMQHPERVHSRGALLDQVWGHHVIVEDRTVDVTVRRLRAQLERNGCDHYVQTVRGAGYRLSLLS